MRDRVGASSHDRPCSVPRDTRAELRMLRTVRDPAPVSSPPLLCSCSCRHVRQCFLGSYSLRWGAENCDPHGVCRLHRASKPPSPTLNLPDPSHHHTPLGRPYNPPLPEPPGHATKALQRPRCESESAVHGTASATTAHNRRNRRIRKIRGGQASKRIPTRWRIKLRAHGATETFAISRVCWTVRALCSVLQCAWMGLKASRLPGKNISSTAKGGPAIQSMRRQRCPCVSSRELLLPTPTLWRASEPVATDGYLAWRRIKQDKRER